MNTYVLMNEFTGMYFNLIKVKDELDIARATKFSQGTRRQAEYIMKHNPAYKLVVFISE